MLRANAAQGIKLPQGDATRPVETVLKQWRIAKSLIRGGKKVNLSQMTLKTDENDMKLRLSQIVKAQRSDTWYLNQWIFQLKPKA